MAGLRWPLQALIAIAWTAISFTGTVKGLGKYNPCSTPDIATRVSSFFPSFQTALQGGSS